MSNDGQWALQWGNQLAHGLLPDFDEPRVSTPHPLTNLIGLVLSPLGPTAAYWAFGAIMLAAYGATVALTFAVGSECFAWPAGVVGALLVAFCPQFVLAAGSGHLDELFLALVMLALWLVVTGRPPVAVFVALFFAGLLRPDAWLLSGAYALWLWSQGDRWPLAVAAAAPLVWLTVDWALTGNPLHALTHTQAGAQALERTTGLANTPGAARRGLANLLTSAGLAGGTAGFLLAIRHRAAWPLLAVGVFGGVAYVGVGVAGLSLLDRYLALPAIVLAICCGYFVTGWAAQGGWVRVAWLTGAVLTTALFMVKAPDRVSAVKASRGQIIRNAAIVSSLRDLDIDAIAGCRPLLVRDHRPRALVANTLRRPASEVLDAHGLQPPASAAFLTVDPAEIRERSYTVFPERAERPPALTPGNFRLAASNGLWQVAAGPGCR